jgi:hypothetical protein
MTSSLVEDRNGVLRVLFDGAIVVTALGSRESTYWSVADLSSGTGPKMQLVSHAGLCSYMKSGRAGRGIGVHVLGTLVERDGVPINMKSCITPLEPAALPCKRAVSVFVGTSAEVGKTTALLQILQRLRKSEPAASILGIKMSGTPSEAEINLYRSYGATQVLNLVDLGFPTSYSVDRGLLMKRVRALLDSACFQSADHVLIELGGDVIGGCNSDIVDLLQEWTIPQFFLAAFDCFGAEGCSRHLRRRGLDIAAVTGKCVANPIVKQRTSELCQVPALSALEDGDLETMLSLHHRDGFGPRVNA